MRLSVVTALMFASLLTTACSQRYFSEDELFQRAQENIERGRYTSAKEPLQQIDTFYPFGRYAQHAQLQLMYVDLKNDDSEQALIRAERFIRLQPQHPHLEYAFYVRALASYQLAVSGRGRFADQAERRDTAPVETSWRHFQSLVQQFPDSSYQQDALTYMADLRQLLARHDLRVASLYHRQGAFVASLARSQQLLINFPGSLHSLEALNLLLANQQALGMTDAAADSQRLLQQWSDER